VNILFKKQFIEKILSGEKTVSKGDWVIKGVKDELYPCKPDIFEATYEGAEEQTQ
jgi:hypothetical protein